MLVDKEQVLEEGTVECSNGDMRPCYGECAARTARLSCVPLCNGMGLYLPASSSSHEGEPTQRHKFFQRLTSSAPFVVVFLFLQWLCRIQGGDFVGRQIVMELGMHPKTSAPR